MKKRNKHTKPASPPTAPAPGALPVVPIAGKSYFRDARLREYRNVQNPHDRFEFGRRPDHVHAWDAPEEVAKWGNDRVVVTWSWLGEGRDGDYDPEDPDDVPLLRIDVEDRTGQERHRGQRSACTNVPAWTPADRLEALARNLAQKLDERESWAPTVREWSWVGEDEAYAKAP